MGKRGPCYHCGVTSTPLWRNGPPEKPVLCNACGSRWRTKGTLVNYTPLHARAEPDDFEDYRVSKNRDSKVFKRKYDSDSTEFGVPLDYNHGFCKKLLDEDTSNRSSTGSAISNSESCAQFGSADASELTGPSQPIIVWDTVVPSRKRTCVTRQKSSPVEKLTKDLYTIWHEQQSSCFSGSSKEELLLESDKPMVSVEIGHGSVLIRHPSSIALKEQSEASSLSIDNKQYTVISRQMTFPGLVEDMGVNSSYQGLQKIDKLASQGMEREQFGRDRDQLEELLILAHHNSPLCYIGLQDVLNSDKFSNHLTNDEQKQLLKFLPSIDTFEGPDSLKRMFGSPQFKENLSSFQKLLADGVFDISFSGVNTEDCRILKKFVLCNLTKSKWVEQYKILENLKGKNCIKGPEIERGPIAASNYYSFNLHTSQDGQQPKFSGAKAVLKSPQRITIKSSNDQKELIDKNGIFFSPRSLFSSQNDVLDSSQIADETPEQDMLLDLPSNSSFPQAELLSVSSFSSKH